MSFIRSCTTILLFCSLARAQEEGKPGEVQERKGANGIGYALRIPNSYDPEKGAPALMWLHGSNMDGKTYAESFVASKWAEEYILICPNGETENGNGGYNYSYFAPKDYRNPYLVEILEEVKSRYKITRCFVGGHSQGAYVTYMLVAEYPGTFQGAIPVSGGMWIQAEPGEFPEEKRQEQRKTAIAIVHGERDNVVDVSMSRSAYASYVDTSFPMVRFFNPAEGDHRFIFLPVPEALRWLEEITSEDPAVLAGFAERALKDERFREAAAACARAGSVKGAAAKSLKAARAALDKLAKPRSAKLLQQIAKIPNDSWVADFLKFREGFEFTADGTKVVAAYLKLRESHEKKAEELFWEARGLFQEDRNDEAYRKYEEIVSKYYASSWYRYAKKGLQDR